MRTSASPRIDNKKMASESLDIDYDLNSQRQARLQILEERIKDLEAEFKNFTTQSQSGGQQIKLAELMQDPRVKVTLEKLRVSKKQAMGLKFDIAEESAEAKKEAAEWAELAAANNANTNKPPTEAN